MSDSGWATAADARALAFVDSLPTGSDPLRLDGADGHHLQRVRRLGVDERVVLADGRGRWVPTRVSEVADGAIGVVATGPVCEEPLRSPTLTVAFAPAKRDHGTEVTHQLVELGVDRIVPLQTERGVVRWDGARGAKHVERLRRVAREAAMQCRRARIPAIEPSTLSELAGRPGLLVADAAGAPVRRASLPDGDTWFVVVGPEGGFAPGELAALGDVPRVAVGPHVLRAVTAPAAVAAAIASLR